MARAGARSGSSGANPLGQNTTAPLILSNAGFYTLDPTGTTFNSPLELNLNTTDTIEGYSVNLNAGLLIPATGPWVLYNDIAQASTLTIGGVFNWSGTETASRIFQILGTGNTIINAAPPGQ